jgi:predicted nucleic acid-binding protein
MLIVDTNVISEIVKPYPSKAIVHWFINNYEDIYMTAFSTQEILYGTEIMPEGKRRTKLQSAYKKLFFKYFENHTIPYDQWAAEEYSKLVAQARAKGRTIPRTDAQISAIVKSYDAALVTRNVKDFEGLGIRLFNPFEV